ncbi:MAG: hypothetical protein NC923_02690 [Candidatus Omnitrophica bacterium]|nr:hypothetical protein [Candidatus Omnitrophota bacterium]
MVKVKEQEVKIFGLALSVVCLLFYGKTNRMGKEYSGYFLIAALFLALSVIVRPRILFPLRGMLKLILNGIIWVLSRMMLMAIFYLIIFPLGILRGIIERDFLGIERSSVVNYWIERKEAPDKENYRRQF